MTSPLLVADGTNLTHRCWHASGRSSDPAVTARMLSSLLRAGIEATNSDRVVIAFDGPDAGAHRYAIYPAYKSGRSEKDDALKTVLAALPGLLSDEGWTVHSSPGIEADDTLAHYAGDLGVRTVLLTSDKDALGLLVHPHVAVLRVSNGGPSGWTFITASNLVDHMGVTSAQYALFCALKGDTSDAIPGVAGIGPGMATKLAIAHTTVDAFIADLHAGGTVTCAAIGAGRTARLTSDIPAVVRALEITQALTGAYPVTDAPDRRSCPIPEAAYLRGPSGHEYASRDDEPPADLDEEPGAREAGVEERGLPVADPHADVMFTPEGELVTVSAAGPDPDDQGPRVQLTALTRSPITTPARPARFSAYL